MSLRSLALPLLVLLVAAVPVRAAENAPAPRTSYTLEGTLSLHNSDRAYFQPGVANWGEGFARARVLHALSPALRLEVGGVVMNTMGTDYDGVGDRADGRLDRLTLTLGDLERGPSLVVGRQELRIGEGFLIGDGYYDTRAARWNIPLSFYDGVTARWNAGKGRVTAFATDYSPSFGDADLGFVPDGLIAGGELAWTPAEGHELAIAYLARDDRSATKDLTRTWSVRGAAARGPWSVTSEAVFESGSFDGVEVAGRGGRLGVTYTHDGPWSPTVRAEYVLLTGDDPDTPEDETYDPWHYTWNDWSNWYLGDMLGSTVGTWTDMRTALLEVKLSPREGTGMRVLAHRFDRDQGKPAPYAWEFDGVLEQSFGERWSAWIMGAWVTPLERAKLESGSDQRTTQVFASVTWRFEGRLGN